MQIEKEGLQNFFFFLNIFQQVAVTLSFCGLHLFKDQKTVFSLKSLFLWQGHLTAPYCVRESCFDRVDDPAYLPTHRYLSSVSPGNRDMVDYHHGLVIDTGGSRGRRL